MLHLRHSSSLCKYVRGFYPSPCVRALVLMSEMHRLMMFWAEQMADIVVLWAGRAVIGSRPSGRPPTAHLGEEDSNQGWWPRGGGRSLRVRTLLFPWGTTSQRGCCSTPATTRHRLKKKTNKKKNKTREQKAALKNPGSLLTWRTRSISAFETSPSSWASRACTTFLLTL